MRKKKESYSCKNGGSIRGNGADRHRRHYGVRALASIYEKIFQGATRYQEFAGESVSFVLYYLVCMSFLAILAEVYLERQLLRVAISPSKRHKIPNRHRCPLNCYLKFLYTKIFFCTKIIFWTMEKLGAKHLYYIPFPFFSILICLHFSTIQCERE